jgi:hypothetical protein
MQIQSNPVLLQDVGGGGGGGGGDDDHCHSLSLYSLLLLSTVEHNTPRPLYGS